MDWTSTELAQMLRASGSAVAGSVAQSAPPAAGMAAERVPGLPSLPGFDWLDRALTEAFPDLPAVDYCAAQSLAVGSFDALYRLQVRYRQPCNAPEVMLCKLVRPAPDARWGEFLREVFQREVTAFQELRHHSACRVPELYGASLQAQNYVVLLQESGEPLPADSLDALPQVEAVLRELARLHGCFARYSPVAAPGWLLRPPAVAKVISQRYKRGLEELQAGEAAWQSLPAGFRELLQAFSDKVEAWHRYERHVLSVSHGDAQIVNALFEGDGADLRASLIGWKLAGLRNPMFDVSSLLVTSLSTETRRRKERVLLEDYRRLFEQSGIRYGATQAQQDYRMQVFAALVFTVCSVSYLGGEVAPAPELSGVLKRSCQAVVDWDALALVNSKL